MGQPKQGADRPEVKLREIGRDCAALRTRMAARAITREYDEALRPLDIKITQFTLLVAIRSEAFGSISEMASWLALERSTLSRNLQVLEGRGLVAREDSGEGRSRVPTITAQGDALLRKAIPIWDGAQSNLKHRIGVRAWNETREALNRLSGAE